MFSADLGGYTAPPPAATDPPFQKVALLLHGDGTNGAQNNTFVDSSSNAFTITRTGNVAQGTFSPFSLAEGQWSNYFDGTGDYLTIPSSTSLQVPTEDFTIEAFVYITTLSGTQTILQKGVAGSSNLEYSFLYDSTTLRFYCSDNGITISILYVLYTPIANQWNHFAVTRSGTSVKFFANGVQVGSTQTISYSTLFAGAGTLSIGMNNTGTSNPLRGYLSNVRFVKGSLVYTGSYTVPTSALTAITNTSLLTCQSNRFKDNSSNNFTITRNGDTKVTAFSPFAPSAAYDAGTNGGSGYFDGSGDYLAAPIDNSFVLGTGDCTIETWVYTGSTTQQAIYDYRDSGFSWSSINFNIQSNQSLAFLAGNFSNSTPFIQGGVVPLNQWVHVAFSRASGTNNLYINGTRVATNTTAWNQSGTATTNNIGRNPYNGGVWYLNGYLSNFRFVKGTAVYSGSTYTIPTAPLTAITNTQLLLNCTNAGIIDNAGKNDIETVGNAQISTSVKKYGTGSMYFDGTGDLLNCAPSIINALGTGNFTIECWAYPTGSSAVKFIAGTGYTAGTWSIGVDNSNGQIKTWKSSNTLAITSSSNATMNAWNHIALVRSSTSTLTLYLNGISVGTTTDASDYTVNILSVGAYDTTGTQSWQGYIDDLRITKGQALYTSNFTLPTQAFPNQ